jgi:hypothetical protein
MSSRTAPRRCRETQRRDRILWSSGFLCIGILLYPGWEMRQVVGNTKVVWWCFQDYRDSTTQSGRVIQAPGINAVERLKAALITALWVRVSEGKNVEGTQATRTDMGTCNMVSCRAVACRVCSTSFPLSSSHPSQRRRHSCHHRQQDIRRQHP